MGSEVQLIGKSRPLLGWVGDILFVLTQLVEDLHGHWCRGTSTTSDLQACGGEDGREQRPAAAHRAPSSNL